MSEQSGNDWLTPRDHAKRSGRYRVRSKRERAREALLGDWIGDPNAAELEIGIHKSGERTLADLCDGLLDRLDNAERSSMRQLMARWPEVAGGFSEQCSPRNLRPDGTLFVAVASPALAFQLRMQERLFLQRIKDIGVLGVRSIRFAPAGATVTEGF